MRITEYKDLRSSFFEGSTKLDLQVVNEIIKRVRRYGDRAVKEYTKKYDRVKLKQLRLENKEIQKAFQKVEPGLLKMLNRARLNIERFSRLQLKQLKYFAEEIASGIIVEQRVVPINRIGIYVPGGRYPLVSTVLMCGVPAIVAGVREVVLCSPPSYHNTIHPLIIATARLIGVKEIYRIGGAQAIAAMAYGTETIRPVDKIFGPGNAYVTFAKKIVYGDVGIDFIGGPSEILIIADHTAEPKYIAADLLAQAEHDINAQPILVTDSTEIATAVKREINSQLKNLRTKAIASESIGKNGIIIITKDIEQAIECANQKAPEHLELHVKNPRKYINKLKNFGSLFIGKYSAEVFGDYCSGINHTLPTNGAARYTGGLHIKDFLKFVTTLKVEKKGIKKIGDITNRLAQVEGLNGHQQSVLIRMQIKS